MKICNDPKETVNLTPLVYKFKKTEDFLFERICYIREVLNNTDRYRDVPDINALNFDLYKLLRDYQEIVGKKINADYGEVMNSVGRN